jgi:hypothetical protein
MRVSEYYWYDPFNPEDWAGFVLNHGKYESIPVNGNGYLESLCTELVLRRWAGGYQGVNTTWLRWANRDGQVIPTAQELAQQAQQRADFAEQRAIKISSKVAGIGHQS